MNSDAILQIAISIAHQAGAIVRAGFPAHALVHIGFKGAVDPVTETDTAAEQLIIARLRAAFPEHRILAEEGGFVARGSDEATSQPPQPGGGGEGGLDGLPASTRWAIAEDDGRPIWLIDPLDGTNNFAHGFPHVGVSLALLAGRQPVVGVIHDPLRDEVFAATAGGGATLNARPIHTSGIERLADAFLATGFPYNRRTATDNNVERLDHFLRRSLGVRRAGAAVLDLAYVACGRFDGFWEIGLKPWDVAAGVLLVREAGGMATDFGGGPDCLSGAFIVASNGHIHEQMLRVIREGAGAPRPDGPA